MVKRARSERPKWTDVVIVIVSLAAAAIAYAAYRVSRNQADSANDQTKIATETLQFARNESRENSRQTRAAINAATRSAEAAERQAELVNRSIDVAEAEQQISREALFAERAGEVSITAGPLQGLTKTERRPFVTFIIRNVGKSVIRRATVQMQIAVLPPGEFKRAFTRMDTQVQTLELGGEEPETVVFPAELAAETINDILTTRTAVVAAAKVSWRDTGNSQLQVRSKCYFWSGEHLAGNGAACPSLGEKFHVTGERP